MKFSAFQSSLPSQTWRTLSWVRVLRWRSLPIGTALKGSLDLVRQGSLDLVRQDSLIWFDKALLTRFEKVRHSMEDWAEKKFTTTRQSRQYTKGSVEWRSITLVVLLRLELSSTRRKSLLRLSTRRSLSVPGARNRTFSERRWTQCTHPGFDGCTARLGRSERFDRRLNISTDVCTCWDFLHGPLCPSPHLLRAISWVNITTKTRTLVLLNLVPLCL